MGEHISRSERSVEVERGPAASSHSGATVTAFGRHPVGHAGISAMQRAAGNAAVAGLLASRRRGAQQPVVQRSAYLANADDLIYGDSEDPRRELAYIGKLFNIDCFVPYPAVDKVRLWWANKAVRIAGLGVKLPKKGAKAGIKKPAQVRKGKAAKAGGGGVIGREESYALRNLMDDVQRDKSALADLTKELQGLYVLVGGSLVPEPIDARWARAMADRILATGPQQMRTGGGSRLPSPVGKVITSGPMSKDQLLTALGVPDEKKAAYAKVTVENAGPDGYLEAYDAARTAGANIIQTEDRATGIWLFDASALQVGRSANSRIQVAGTSYGRDTDFLSIDPTKKKGQDINRRLRPAQPSDHRHGVDPRHPADEGRSG